MQRPFNFQHWIDTNRNLLKPPVSNKALFEAGGMIVQVVGGPNHRVDFHDDPGEEFFYQLRGDMVLKVIEQGIQSARVRCSCSRHMSGTHLSDQCALGPDLPH